MRVEYMEMRGGEDGDYLMWYTVAATSPPLPDWRGLTVACIASGPSLQPADLEAVRAAGVPAIVVRRTIVAAPWAAWWHCDRWSWPQHLAKIGPRAGGTLTFPMNVPEGTVPGLGLQAIFAAIQAGARRILLLGYTGGYDRFGRQHFDDCEQPPDAEPFYEGPPDRHQESLMPCHGTVAKIAAARGVDVVNCDAGSHIVAYRRGTLAGELG